MDDPLFAASDHLAALANSENVRPRNASRQKGAGADARGQSAPTLQQQQQQHLAHRLQSYVPPAIKRFLDGTDSDAPWQDELLRALMEVDADRISDILDHEGDKAAKATLHRREVGGRTVFTLAEKLYKEESALRDVIGGEYVFEREEPRALLASWLEMIGARDGDTILHLCLRLNGVDLEEKAQCVVAMIGRGTPWEVANKDGALPSMVDHDAFREAFFHLLPAWKAKNHQREQERAREAATKRKEMATLKAREARRAEQDRTKKHWAAAKAKVDEELQQERARAKYVHRLEGALAKLERREQRQALTNPAWTELMTDLRQLPGRFERWLKYDLLFS